MAMHRADWRTDAGISQRPDNAADDMQCHSKAEQHLHRVGALSQGLAIQCELQAQARLCWRREAAREAAVPLPGCCHRQAAAAA